MKFRSGRARLALVGLTALVVSACGGSVGTTTNDSAVELPAVVATTAPVGEMEASETEASDPVDPLEVDAAMTEPAEQAAPLETDEVQTEGVESTEVDLTQTETEGAETAPDDPTSVPSTPAPTIEPTAVSPTPAPEPTAEPAPILVPELTGQFATIGGGQIDLASLQGQDVVLWFWAPW